MDPLINLPNIIVDDIGDITLELGVDPHTIINTSAPKLQIQVLLSPKATRLDKLAKGYSNFDHALIS
jgi:hypothetical protein